MISTVQGNAAPLYGLVLAGGRSVRMGHDKGAISWHGREQRYYAADMLASFCERVFISCRPEQQPEVDAAYSTIADSYEGGGPLVGIMSAFRAYPAAAWLVVACDLPLLDTATLQDLVSSRQPTGIATTYRSPHDQLPEPLITIWEPAAYPVLQAHMAAGYKCPRKALIFNGAKVNITDPAVPAAIMNTNTPEDAGVARNLLGMG